MVLRRTCPCCQLLDSIGPHQYDFMSAANFDGVLKHDWRAAMRIYWLEIFNRAHFAACGGLVRTHRWISAALEHASVANYTAFCAAYRGCMGGLSRQLPLLRVDTEHDRECSYRHPQGVIGQADVFCVFKELEDDLIHFTHARHVAKGEVVDESHRAKMTKRYLDALFGKDAPAATD